MNSSTASNVPLITRADLFGNPLRTAARISPDGRFLSWLAPLNGVLNIWVASLDDLEHARAVTNDAGRGIHLYGWTYGGHLFYLQDVDGNEDFHIYVADPQTQTARNLTPFEGVTAQILGSSRIVRDRLLVGLNRRDPRYFDLYTLVIATGELELVEQNTNFAGFIADEHYRPHFATRIAGNGTLEVHKRTTDNTWVEWTTFDAADAWTSGPRHLNADGSALFMFDSRGRNTAALTRLDLASGEVRIIAADPRVDITHILLDIQTREPVAYRVEVDRPVYVALTPEVQHDMDFLNGQNLGDWHRVSRSEDDRLWVITGSSDTRAPTTYLYDRNSQALRTLFEHRPRMKGAPFVPMKPVAIRSRDGFDLMSYLSRPVDADGPGPLVLLVHGGPWGRDTFGFNFYHQWLANRGYSVLSVNFRGSTGFGKTFVNAGDGEWGRRMDDDLLDAVAWAIAEGVAEPSRVAIMGGSYGGYAALAGMTRNPEVYACGVDIVGPSNLETLVSTFPAYWEAGRTQIIRAVGDPATDEGRALLRDRSPVHRAERISKPLLIGQGANDPRVKRDESDQMANAMKANGIPVTYVLYPDEGHGFARPENDISFNAITEAFLERHLGGRAEPMTSAEWNGSTAQILEGADQLDLPSRA